MKGLKVCLDIVEPIENEERRFLIMGKNKQRMMKKVFLDYQKYILNLIISSEKIVVSICYKNSKQ